MTEEVLPFEVEEYTRICFNPVKFLEYCKINDAVSQRVIDFEFWPHLVDLISAFQRERQIIVLKSKQVGVSYLIAFYSLWRALTIKAFNALLLSAGEKESALLLEKCKFAYQNLPEFLRLPVGKYSESEITFPEMGSRIAALPSTEIPGIGATASLVVMDEWDFHRYPESDYATAEPTASAGGQIIGVSTVDKSKPDSLFKSLYKQAKNSENNFYPIFLPWNIRPGRDKEWYEFEKRAYIDREYNFEENYPETEREALSPLSARGFFDGDTLNRLLESCRQPIETKEGIVHIYSNWRPGVAYCAAADESQGQGGDYQCLVVLGKQGLTSEVVAMIHSNNITTDVFAYMTEQLLKEYKYPLLAGEANPIGIAYLNKLQELNYPRLYYSDEKRERVGWLTSKYNRETSLLELSEALRSGHLLTYYKPMVLEMFNFQRTARGRVEAVGGHDDTVMALDIANQMLKHISLVVKVKEKPLLVERKTGGMYE